MVSMTLRQSDESDIGSSDTASSPAAMARTTAALSSRREMRRMSRWRLRSALSSAGSPSCSARARPRSVERCRFISALRTE